MVPLFLFLGANLALLVWLFRYVRKYHGVLEELNIPVIKPHFLLGSNPNGYKEILHEEDLKNMRKYGPIYGAYDGRSPNVYINDPELMKLILVKDYEHFNQRQPPNFGHPLINEILDWLPKDKWKAVRSQVTQSFVSSRLKHMSETLKLIAEDHINHLKNRFEGQNLKLNFRQWVGLLTTDICGRCYFGVEFQNVKDPNNEVTTLFKNLLGEHWKHNFFTFHVTALFPFITNVLPLLPKKSVDKVGALTLSLIKERQKSGVKQNDPADVFASFLDKLNAPEYKALGITEDTVVCQAMESFFATYDSTGTPMSFLIYYLAKYPTHQERLLKEIDSVLKKSNGKIIYENISDGDMPFMTACFSESARLCPSFFRIERICTQTWEHDGIRIPKGQNVVFPLWAANRHPDYHRHPETFDPNRFMGENKTNMNPYAFSTFGHGPMNCPGVRWAYQINKIILMSFFKEFTVKERPDSKIVWKRGNGYLLQYEPLLVDVLKRN